MNSVVKIKSKGNDKTIKYGDIAKGDYFLYKDELYLEIASYNALRLSDCCCIDSLFPDDRVTLVDVEITYLIK